MSTAFRECIYVVFFYEHFQHPVRRRTLSPACPFDRITSHYAQPDVGFLGRLVYIRTENIRAGASSVRSSVRSAFSPLRANEPEIVSRTERLLWLSLALVLPLDLNGFVGVCGVCLCVCVNMYVYTWGASFLLSQVHAHYGWQPLRLAENIVGASSMASLSHGVSGRVLTVPEENHVERSQCIYIRWWRCSNWIVFRWMIWLVCFVWDIIFLMWI